MKEDVQEMDISLLGGEISAHLQSTPVTHHDGKARGPSWSFKKNKNKGGSKGGEEGGSDSDSDSDSASSSSDHSGSSDESGDSEEEVGGGRLLFDKNNARFYQIRSQHMKRFFCICFFRQV